MSDSSSEAMVVDLSEDDLSSVIKTEDILSNGIANKMNDSGLCNLAIIDKKRNDVKKTNNGTLNLSNNVSEPAKVPPGPASRKRKRLSTTSTRSSRSSSTEVVPQEPKIRKEESPSTQEDEQKETMTERQLYLAKLFNQQDIDDDFLGFEEPVDTNRRDAYYTLVEKESKTLKEAEMIKENSAPEEDEEINDSSFLLGSDKIKTEPAQFETPSDSDPYVMGVINNTDTKRRSSKKSPIDMNSPLYKLPLEQGWIRELVYRNVNMACQKRIADVYYYSPTGRKIRSARELLEHLTGDLTMDNFTFFKESIGVNDGVKEIVRGARPKNNDPYVDPIRKLCLKPIFPKPETPSPVAVKSPVTPKVAFKAGSPKESPPAKKYPSKKKLADKKRKSAGPDDHQMTMDSDWTPDQKANPTREICSIECRLAMGLIPSLHCISCLCLYHPECVGFQQDKLGPSQPYICKNCQVMNTGPPSVHSSLKNPTSPAVLPPPPPLTPISGRSNKVPSPPKRDSSSISSSFPSKVPPLTAPRNQPIVGALTTWLPHSSSIQVSQSSPTPKTTTTSSAPSVPTPPTENPQQGLLSLSGSSYVIIPRHNIVNVSNQSGSSSSSSQSMTATAAPAPPPIPSVPPNRVPNRSNSFSNAVPLSNRVINPPGILLVPYGGSSEASFDPNSQFQSPIVPAVGPGLSSQTPESATQSNDLKSMNEPVVDSSLLLVEKKPVRVRDVSPYSHGFMTTLNAGFSALLHAFQYLKVHELLRASCVSHMWNLIASHTSLWEVVRMKNSRVRDWEGFGNALRKHSTKSLDLKKMLLPESTEATNEMWTQLSIALSRLPELKRIDLGRCTPQALDIITKACPQLESVVSLAIRGPELDLVSFTHLENLTELRLKSFGGIELKNLTALKELKNLKTLALTTMKKLEGIENVLSPLLENLELGDCVSLTESLATDTFPKLINLKRLRLEKGQSPNCPTVKLINAISNLPNLFQLELINFDIKPGFEKALANCSNIKVLLIIPTYVTQSATTNHVVMGGVSKLSATLVYFIWGLTLELLKVTDLFIDQVEGQKGKTASSKKSGAGDSIPILKPLGEEGNEFQREGQSASQVDILGLPKLQRVLSTLLPQTKIKILKVPFSATWRQTVTDGPLQ